VRGKSRLAVKVTNRRAREIVSSPPEIEVKMYAVQEATRFGDWRNISQHAERREAKREAKRLQREAKERKRHYQYRYVPVTK
jgi:hypothetical protein